MLLVYLSKNSWWNKRKARKVLLPQAFSRLPGHRCLLVNAALPWWMRPTHPRHWQNPDATFRVITPRRWLPLQRFRWTRWFNQCMQLREVNKQLRIMLASWREQVAFVISDPEMVYLAKDLRSGGWPCFYDWSERWEDYAIAMGRQSQQKVQDINEILENVDGVVVVSRELETEATARNIPCLHLPNAVSDDFITALEDAPKAPLPDLLVNCPSPRVAHIGNVNPIWIDWDCLITSAIANPDVSFCLIGGGRKTGIPSQIPSNVHLLGLVPYEDLPSILAYIQVCMVLYKPDKTAANDPTKLYEYLAAGMPIVSTMHPRSVEMKHLLALARTPEEFANQIQRALTGDIPVSQQARKEEIARHRWSIRAERLLAWLQAH